MVSDHWREQLDHTRSLARTRTLLDQHETDAQRLVDDSEGQVMDETTRDNLSMMIRNAHAIRSNSQAPGLDADLTRAMNGVRASMDDWNREQERIARQAIEQETIRQATIQAQAQSQVQAVQTQYAPTNPGPTVSPAPSWSAPAPQPSYSYASASSCIPRLTTDVCQSAVDTGGMVDLNYGDTHVYAQHNIGGHSSILSIQPGQQVTVNGVTYTAGQSFHSTTAPSSGKYLMTCDLNNNRTLVPLN